MSRSIFGATSFNLLRCEPILSEKQDDKRLSSGSSARVELLQTSNCLHSVSVYCLRFRSDLTSFSRPEFNLQSQFWVSVFSLSQFSVSVFSLSFQSQSQSQFSVSVFSLKSQFSVSVFSRNLSLSFSLSFRVKLIWGCIFDPPFLILNLIYGKLLSCVLTSFSVPLFCLVTCFQLCSALRFSVQLQCSASVFSFSFQLQFLCNYVSLSFQSQFSSLVTCFLLCSTLRCSFLSVQFLSSVFQFSFQFSSFGLVSVASSVSRSVLRLYFWPPSSLIFSSVHLG
jgi:hypothetical protein